MAELFHVGKFCPNKQCSEYGKVQNLMLDPQKNPSAKKKADYEAEIRNLLSYTDRNKPCSSVAIAYIVKSDVQWVKHLAPSIGR